MSLNEENRALLVSMEMSREYGDFYREMELMREESDYNCFYNVTAEQMESRIPRAKEMIDTIAEMVKEQ